MHDTDYPLSSSPPSALAYVTEHNDDHPLPSSSAATRPLSPPSTTATTHPERPAMPARASTVGSPGDLNADHSSRDKYDRSHARSEDLNHSSATDPSSSQPPRPVFFSNSQASISSSPSSSTLSPIANSLVSRPSASASGSSYTLARKPSSVASHSSDLSSTSYDPSVNDNAAPSTAHTTSTNLAST